MFSQQLIEQLSNFIIRPHRQLYGLDKLGPKKIIIKSNTTNNYIDIYRQQSTIISNSKKVQVSFFHPQPLNPENLTTIFLHTNSGSRLQGLQYSKFLLQNGQQVCLFDYSGSGVSEGDYVSMGVNEAKDLANVIAHLKQKYLVNQVNLWGRSMGAVTAVLYASKYPNNVKRIVLDSPFCSFRQLVKQIVNSRTGLPEFLYGTILSRIEEHIIKKINVNLMDIDLRNQIIRLGMQKIPIFFLISKDDKLVKPVHVETLYELHKGPKKIIYLQGSHNKPRPTEIRQKCSDFFISKISTVGSQKIIQNSKKKQCLNLMGRMHSQSSVPSQFQYKNINHTFGPNLSQVVFVERERERERQEFEALTGNSVGQPLVLNLGKKVRPEIMQSSAQNTPREENSLSKYASSKISLSQLKKGHTPGEVNLNAHKYQVDFKKQPKIMAIQYKNKIKEQINRS